MDIEFGKIKIELERNTGYHWHRHGRIWVKGYCYLDDILYQGELFTDLLFGKSEDEVLKLLKRIDGFYSIVIQFDKHIIAAVDHVRSFPLFYYKKNEVFHICDSLDEERIVHFEMDEDSERLLWGSLYTIGEMTLFKGVSGISAGHYLKIDQNLDIQLIEYWHFAYRDRQICEANLAVQKLDKVYRESFKRLIHYLNGRTAVVPLSGGHDSRLIAYHLKENKYDKIIAFSYGDETTEDARLSKMVADTLDIPYYFIPYDRSNLQLAKDPAFKAYLIFASNGVSVPRVQTWYGLKWLVDNKIIDSNCIVVPGYGGILSGHYISDTFVEGEAMIKEELCNRIRDTFFGAIRRKYPEFAVSLREMLMNYGLLADQEDPITMKKAAELFEWFIFLEDQAKGIQNANRAYEFFGLKWTTPLFEKSQFDAWSEIDNSLRHKDCAYRILEQKLYSGEIMDIPFTGSKESGHHHEHPKSTPVQRLNSLLKACISPRKSHYMNVAIPRHAYYYSVLIERQRDSFHYFKKMYIKDIKRIMK